MGIGATVAPPLKLCHSPAESGSGPRRRAGGASTTPTDAPDQKSQNAILGALLPRTGPTTQPAGSCVNQPAVATGDGHRNTESSYLHRAPRYVGRGIPPVPTHVYRSPWLWGAQEVRR
jgi:hypothetical protein